eukprot:scaffold20914_cov135-Isochrysis_galbana.AAC.2
MASIPITVYRVRSLAAARLPPKLMHGLVEDRGRPRNAEKALTNRQVTARPSLRGPWSWRARGCKRRVTRTVILLAARRCQGPGCQEEEEASGVG